MNDFELHYVHSARSRELMADAAYERLAESARAGSGLTRRRSLTARIADALRRKEAPAAEPARRLQPAK
ncbi:hypothetical protein L0U85_01845 [Glycomyces sp. L485]|uniref:hypothetical protein n=1 Tax=Glycomyces sp. L485 TaxID=2909235 RepID=UPI001F4ABF84|nr:hypothetical protein [Glycomyces sp. L485]MCH7229610.1 hypothetical protein [Glycomyces sp. L485]